MVVAEFPWNLATCEQRGKYPCWCLICRRETPFDDYVPEVVRMLKMSYEPTRRGGGVYIIVELCRMEALGGLSG